jgi:hypothetical protein
MFQQHLRPEQQLARADGHTKQLNDFLAGAAKQWSDAAQFSQSRQHQMALQNNALNAGLQMKKMEMDRDAQKYNVLGGLLRSATGMGGFRIDGKGRRTDL